MHRVYVHDGDIWTLASAYRHDLTADNEYVVFETQRPPSYEEVCFVTDDGRRLCDFGPDHAHGFVEPAPSTESQQRGETALRTFHGD